MGCDLTFDEEGHAWPTYSQTLSVHLGLRASVPALPDFLVKNLGYMRVTSQHNRAVITLRPTVAEHGALIGLMYYLTDNNFRSVAVRVYDDAIDDWRHEIVGTVTSAIRHVAKLLSLSMEGEQASSFLTRKVPLENVSVSSHLHTSIRYFRDSNGKLDLNRISDFADMFSGRYMLYKVDSETARIILVSVGESFPKPIQKFLSGSIGKDIRDRPDANYADECAKAYLSVARNPEPACFEIDALSKWSPDVPLLRRCYRRVILPLVDDAEQTWLLGQSTVDNSINLRRAAQ